MKILICGCIAAGKTTLALKVTESYPEMDYVSIDEIRNAVGDGENSGEVLALDKFVDRISETRDAIVEWTGFGEEGELVFQMLRNTKEPILLILLRVSTTISKERLSHRKGKTKFPDYELKLERMIYSVYYKFVSGSLPGKWSEVEGITILQQDNKTFDDQKFIINFIAQYIEKNRS